MSPRALDLVVILLLLPPLDYNIALLRRKASQAALLLQRPQDDVISVAKATPSTR